LKIKEILGYKFTVTCPTDGTPILTADVNRNKLIAAYTKAEFSLYNHQIQDAEEYARASSFWKELANPDGTINSAYGHLIWGRKICGNPDFEAATRGLPGVASLCQEDFAARMLWAKEMLRTPWQWAMDTLRQDKDSRQAIMHFNTPDFLWRGNKDVTCTLVAQFFIREDKLHLFIDMRSNDVVRGLVYDCVWFASLIHRAVKELLPLYPHLQVGDYVHYAHSMHIYERHFAMAEAMLY
jgi:hypothetical protein